MSQTTNHEENRGDVDAQLTELLEISERLGSDPDYQRQELFDSACQLLPILNESQRARLVDGAQDGNDVKHKYLLALMLFWGYGGLGVSEARSFQLRDEAATLGHAYAIFFKAEMILEKTYDLTSIEELNSAADEAGRWFLRAWDAGVREASFTLGMAYEKGQLGFQVNLFLAAAHYLCEPLVEGIPPMQNFRHLLDKFHPGALAPWGQWQPRRDVHQLVPDQVHAAMKTWLLVARRLRFPRDIAGALVAPLISTKSAWDLQALTLKIHLPSDWLS